MCVAAFPTSFAHCLKWLLVRQAALLGIRPHQPGHPTATAADKQEYFAEVDEDYILDRFNLTGLNSDVVQEYSRALDLITDSLGRFIPLLS